jgi:hypothetical protein
VVAELQAEVTQARAATIMAECRATRAERMAHERVFLLATVRGEVEKAAQRVSTLEGELVATRRA